MEEIINVELINLIIGGFPMLSAAVVGWLLAEKRSQRYLDHYIEAEKRTRAVLRDCRDLDSELTVNGSG